MVEELLLYEHALPVVGDALEIIGGVRLAEQDVDTFLIAVVCDSILHEASGRRQLVGNLIEEALAGTL